MTPLYIHNGKKIHATDFLKALKHLGVAPGDTLFVHPDISVFGKLALQNKDTLLSGLVGVFQDSVGKTGTIAMPTFTYSFCNGVTYDKMNTRSTVGALTEFFRHQPGVERSVHPIFSVAAWGNDKARILKTRKDCFGRDTVFGTLHAMNAKIVLFGVSFQACTFLHYVEQIHAGPYRSMNTFHGTIIDGKRTYEDAYTYFVRPLDGSVENDFNRIEPYLRREDLLKETMVGNGTILLVSARDLFDAGASLLDADPYYFLQQTV